MYLIYFTRMPYIFSSRTTLNTAPFWEQFFEYAVNENNYPSTKKYGKRREKKCCPHSFAITQWIETFVCVFQRTCWTITHYFSFCPHEYEPRNLKKMIIHIFFSYETLIEYSKHVPKLTISIDLLTYRRCSIGWRLSISISWKT